MQELFSKLKDSAVFMAEVLFYFLMFTVLWFGVMFLLYVAVEMISAL